MINGSTNCATPERPESYENDDERGNVGLPHVEQRDIVLSIIVPVYNAMPYLKECVESIYDQDIPLDQYESIFIDDGSTDGSGEYLDSVKHEYPNMVVLHQENSGSPSIPRNSGIATARGTYLFFCDADDLFCPNVFASMIDHAQKTGLDVGLFKISREGRGGDYRGLFDEARKHVPPDDYRALSLMGPYKLISRDLIVSNGIEFVPGITKEDQPFTLRCYLNACNICVICDQPYYRYRLRDDGISTSLGGLLPMLNTADNHFRGLQEYFKAANEYTNPHDMPLIYYRAFESIIDNLRSFAQTPQFHEEAMRYRELVKPYYCDAIRGTLPFNMLIGLDALGLETSDEQLREALDIRKYTSSIFFEDDETGRHSYRLESGQDCSIIFDTPTPQDAYLHERLLNPEFHRNRITSARISDGALHVSGTLDVLINSESQSCMLAVRLQTPQDDFAQEFECAIETIRFSPAYTHVRYLAATWTCTIPLNDLTVDEEEEGATRFDLYTSIAFDDGKTLVYRSGALRDECTADDFLNFSELVEKTAFIPFMTNQGNFYVLARHADTLLKATSSCAIGSLAWEGDNLNLEGTVIIPYTSGVSATVDIVSDETTACSFPVSLEQNHDSSGFLWSWAASIEARTLFNPAIDCGDFGFQFTASHADEHASIRFGRQRRSGTARLFKRDALTESGFALVPRELNGFLSFSKFTAQECCERFGTVTIDNLAWEGMVLRIEGTFSHPISHAPGFIFSIGLANDSEFFAASSQEWSEAEEWTDQWSAAFDFAEYMQRCSPGCYTVSVRKSFAGAELIEPFGSKRPQGTFATFKATKPHIKGAVTLPAQTESKMLTATIKTTEELLMAVANPIIDELHWERDELCVSGTMKHRLLFFEDFDCQIGLRNGDHFERIAFRAFEQNRENATARWSIAFNPAAMLHNRPIGSWEFGLIKSIDGQSERERFGKKRPPGTKAIFMRDEQPIAYKDTVAFPADFGAAIGFKVSHTGVRKLIDKSKRKLRIT